MALLFIAFSLLGTSVVSSAPTILSGKYITVTISGKSCDVTASPYNAVGDGKKSDTDAIQKALDDNSCGQILIPAPHKFLITALKISRSNCELHIQQGATLLVSNDFKNFPANEHVISARGVNNIAISGSGTVDGQGLVWWREMKKPGKDDMWRPHLVDFSHVQTGLLTDTLYLNGPNHVLELGCDHCELSHVRVLSPPSTGDCQKTDTCSHNTDAVDVHGDPFYVHDVNFTTGDDNIAAHANNTLVEDSYFGSGHGASIGSLCGNYLRNITFRNITFVGTTAGARIKSHPGCGGHVWDVTYENLRMHDVAADIVLNQFYAAPKDPPHSTMFFDNITFRDIKAYKSGSDGITTQGEIDVNFSCDDHYNRKGNCLVFMDNLTFSGGAKMYCKGVYGASHNVEGIHNCVKSM